MPATVIHAPAAPPAIGPYSQAISAPAGRLVFCSGQIPLTPDGEGPVGADAAAQAEQVLANLGAVLAAAGASLHDVVKTTIYLVDMADFAAVNAVYAAAFDPARPPARATVAVAALPRGARVEIDAIALAQD